jgi:hypothetical protein
MFHYQFKTALDKKIAREERESIRDSNKDGDDMHHKILDSAAASVMPAAGMVQKHSRRPVGTSTILTSLKETESASSSVEVLSSFITDIAKRMAMEYLVGIDISAHLKQSEDSDNERVEVGLQDDGDQNHDDEKDNMEADITDHLHFAVRKEFRRQSSEAGISDASGRNSGSGGGKFSSLAKKVLLSQKTIQSIQNVPNLIDERNALPYAAERNELHQSGLDLSMEERKARQLKHMLAGLNHYSTSSTPSTKASQSNGHSPTDEDSQRALKKSLEAQQKPTATKTVKFSNEVVDSIEETAAVPKQIDTGGTMLPFAKLDIEPVSKASLQSSSTRGVNTINEQHMQSEKLKMVLRSDLTNVGKATLNSLDLVPGSDTEGVEDDDDDDNGEEASRMDTAEIQGSAPEPVRKTGPGGFTKSRRMKGPELPSKPRLTYEDMLAEHASASKYRPASPAEQDLHTAQQDLQRSHLHSVVEDASDDAGKDWARIMLRNLLLADPFYHDSPEYLRQVAKEDTELEAAAIHVNQQLGLFFVNEDPTRPLSPLRIPEYAALEARTSQKDSWDKKPSVVDTKSERANESNTVLNRMLDSMGNQLGELIRKKILLFEQKMALKKEKAKIVGVGGSSLGRAVSVKVPFINSATLLDAYTCAEGSIVDVFVEDHALSSNDSDTETDGPPFRNESASEANDVLRTGLNTGSAASVSTAPSSSSASSALTRRRNSPRRIATSNHSPRTEDAHKNARALIEESMKKYARKLMGMHVVAMSLTDTRRQSLGESSFIIPTEKPASPTPPSPKKPTSAAVFDRLAITSLRPETIRPQENLQAPSIEEMLMSYVPISPRSRSPTAARQRGPSLDSASEESQRSMGGKLWGPQQQLPQAMALPKEASVVAVGSEHTVRDPSAADDDSDIEASRFIDAIAETIIREAHTEVETLMEFALAQHMRRHSTGVWSDQSLLSGTETAMTDSIDSTPIRVLDKVEGCESDQANVSVRQQRASSRPPQRSQSPDARVASGNRLPILGQSAAIHSPAKTSIPRSRYGSRIKHHPTIFDQLLARDSVISAEDVANHSTLAVPGITAVTIRSPSSPSSRKNVSVHTGKPADANDRRRTPVKPGSVRGSPSGHANSRTARLSGVAKLSSECSFSSDSKASPPAMVPGDFRRIGADGVGNSDPAAAGTVGEALYQMLLESDLSGGSFAECTPTSLYLDIEQPSEDHDMVVRHYLSLSDHFEADAVAPMTDDPVNDSFLFENHSSALLSQHSNGTENLFPGKNSASRQPQSFLLSFEDQFWRDENNWKALDRQNPCSDDNTGIMPATSIGVVKGRSLKVADVKLPLNDEFDDDLDDVVGRLQDSLLMPSTTSLSTLSRDVSPAYTMMLQTEESLVTHTMYTPKQTSKVEDLSDQASGSILSRFVNDNRAMGTHHDGSAPVPASRMLPSNPPHLVRRANVSADVVSNVIMVAPSRPKSLPVSSAPIRSPIRATRETGTAVAGADEHLVRNIGVCGNSAVVHEPKVVRKEPKVVRKVATESKISITLPTIRQDREKRDSGSLQG